MNIRVQNVFADLPGPPREEHFLTLFEIAGVKIERIVSRLYTNPSGFWYDQDNNEWVILLRGNAILKFEGGELV